MFNWGTKRSKAKSHVKPISPDELRNRRLERLPNEISLARAAQAAARGRGDVSQQILMLEDELAAWLQLLVANWRVNGGYQDALEAITEAQRIGLNLSDLPGGRKPQGEVVNESHFLLIAAKEYASIPTELLRTETPIHWDFVDSVLICRLLGEGRICDEPDRLRGLLAEGSEVARSYNTYFAILDGTKPQSERVDLIRFAELNWSKRKSSSAQYPGVSLGTSSAANQVDVDLRLSAILSSIDIDVDSPHAWPWETGIEC
ncbi:hypothetical protein [Maricaulis sp. MIT060901]|uniref:hypothetical protein n=1 Tax=Maricaulis sp. MIT060901 TaxID=3096993 RepID=UPI00399B587A